MKTHKLHEWNISAENAKAIQKNLRAWIVTEGPCPSLNRIGRIRLSASTDSQSQRTTVQACIDIRTFPDQRLLERKVAIKTSDFPRLPGMHSFRKGPAIEAALKKLNRQPDLFICDGRGLTGQEQFGVASHAALLTNLPTVGVRPVKASPQFDVLGPERGSCLPLTGNGQHAVLLRVLDGLEPLLVSPAHRIGMKEAVRAVLGYISKDTLARDYEAALYPAAGLSEHNPVPLKLVKRVVNGK